MTPTEPKIICQRLFFRLDELHTILTKLMADEEVSDEKINRALRTSKNILNLVALEQREVDWEDTNGE